MIGDRARRLSHGVPAGGPGPAKPGPRGLVAQGQAGPEARARPSDHVIQAEEPRVP
jgi:hypothetical protein